MNLITADHICVRFGDVEVLHDINLSVQPAEIVTILGPNGSGKSTTMRMLLALDRPDRGAVRIDNQKMTSFAQPMRTVGALLDASYVHPTRKAREHLWALAASNGLAKKRVDHVLGLVGLEEVATKRVGGFSLGMKQRLGLAAALLGDPRNLIFDEPANGLDPEGIVWIRGFMRQLASEGRTVFVSSHLLAEMALTADHLIVIGRGRLIADCSVSEFTSRAQTSVRVRGPQLEDLHVALAAAGLAPAPGPADAKGRPVMVVPDTTTDQVGDLAAAAGVVLHELTEETASLEEVFMQVTAGDVEYQGGTGVVA